MYWYFISDMKVLNEEEEAAAAELTRKPRSLLRQSKYIYIMP